MPLMIRQVVVKTTISESSQDKDSPKEQGGSQDTEAIIAECIDRVMEILKEEKER